MEDRSLVLFLIIELRKKMISRKEIISEIFYFLSLILQTNRLCIQWDENFRMFRQKGRAYIIFFFSKR